MKLRYCLADTETAGFDGPDATSSGVVEAAFIELDEHTNIIRRESSLIDPQRPISEGAFAVHGITDQMVRGRPTMKQFMERVWPPGPTVFIAHNVPFDKKFYYPHFDVVAGELCTLAAARKYIHNTTNHKLVTLTDQLGLIRGSAHRATGDVEGNLQLLRYIIKVSGRTLPELVKLFSKPTQLTKVPFGMFKGESFNTVPVSYLRWCLAQEGMPPDMIFSCQQTLKVRGLQ